MKLAERISDELLYRVWHHVTDKLLQRPSYTGSQHWRLLAKSPFGMRTLTHCEKRTELWQRFEEERRQRRL